MSHSKQIQTLLRFRSKQVEASSIDRHAIWAFCVQFEGKVLWKDFPKTTSDKRAKRIRAKIGQFSFLSVQMCD